MPQSIHQSMARSLTSLNNAPIPIVVSEDLSRKPHPSRSVRTISVHSCAGNLACLSNKVNRLLRRQLEHHQSTFHSWKHEWSFHAKVPGIIDLKYTLYKCHLLIVRRSCAPLIYVRVPGQSIALLVLFLLGLCN